jgi:hypothetical protein
MLREEIEEWKEKVIKESERIKLVKEWHHRLREGSEEHFRKAYEGNQRFQGQVGAYATSPEYLKDMLSKHFQVLGTALPVLEELRKRVSLVVS